MTKKIIEFSVFFLILLFVTLFSLKVLDVIDWSWWWITSPIWGPALLFSLVIGILVCSVMIKTRQESNDRLEG